LSGSPYLSDVRLVFPRVLSIVDAEPFSKTYGCGDRTYWCWKFTDFPGARFQEYVFALAWFYRKDSGGWQENRLLLELCEAGMNYWSGIQYPDGSFDEAYPFERSLAAASFTVFYLSEAYFLLETDITPATRERFLRTLLRASRWLSANDERHGVLSNHLAAAAAALFNAHIVFAKRAPEDSKRFLERSRHFLSVIYSHQDRDEGWYEEYGGADIGYQTHGSFYLARIWQKSQDPELLSSLKRANAFLSHFVHPDGSMGGEYASRNTSFYFPAAFEILASQCEHAAAIADEQGEKLGQGRTVGLRQMDPQNLFPMLNNYLFAHEARQHRATTRKAALACKSSGEWHFLRAGLFVKSTPSYYSVTSLKKGGVVACWDKTNGALAFQSAGYVTKLGKKLCSTQALNRSQEKREGSAWQVSAPFVPIKQKVFSPWLFVGFRLFVLLVARIGRLSYWLKRLLVRTLVIQEDRKVGAPLLRRRLEFLPDRLVVEDSLEGLHGPVTHYSSFSSIHMGSSRYAHLEQALSRGAGFPRARISEGAQGEIERCEVTFS
jgi:hypothetical protein